MVLKNKALQRQMGTDRPTSSSGNPFEIILVSGIIFDEEDEGTTLSGESDYKGVPKGFSNTSNNLTLH